MAERQQAASRPITRMAEVWRLLPYRAAHQPAGVGSREARKRDGRTYEMDVLYEMGGGGGLVVLL